MLIAATALLLVWIAAWMDFRTFRIANALTLTGAIAGILLNAFSEGWIGSALGLSGFVLALAFFMPLNYLGRMGAGDVKLLAAVGALLGPWWLLKALVPILIFAGGIAVSYALVARRGRGASGPFERYARMIRYLWTLGRIEYLPPVPGEAMAERLPLAVPIALGTTVAVFWRVWTVSPGV